MLIKSLVRSVDLQGTAEKPYAVLVIETTDPLEIKTLRLFKNAIDDGSVAKLKTCIGRTLDLPLQVDLYKGNIQYQMPYGAVIQVPTKAA